MQSADCLNQKYSRGAPRKKLRGRIDFGPVSFSLKCCYQAEKTSIMICLEDSSIFVDLNRSSSAEFSFLAYFRHVRRKVFLNLKYFS